MPFALDGDSAAPSPPTAHSLLGQQQPLPGPRPQEEAGGPLPGPRGRPQLSDPGIGAFVRLLQDAPPLRAAHSVPLTQSAALAELAALRGRLEGRLGPAPLAA